MKQTRSTNEGIPLRAGGFPRPCDWFDGRYFRLTFKAQWPVFMLFAIICFFGMPLSLIFALSNVNNPLEIDSVYLSALNGIQTALPFVLAVAGLFCGCSVLRDLMKPASSFFVHSLPYRRECQLLVRLAAGLSVFASFYFLNLILAVLVSLLYRMGGLMLPLFGGIPVNIAVFCFFFFLTVLCGMLCGTTVTQVILTLMTLVFPPLVYVMGVTWVGTFVKRLWTGWYLDSPFCRYAFPGARFIQLLDENGLGLTWAEYLVIFFLCLVMTVLSVLLYRKRVLSRTGDAAAFPVVGTVVKYASMVPAAQIGAWVLYEIAYNGASGWWSFFGMISAAFLTFMIANAVLNRSARAVLRGWKGLIVFCLIFCALNFCVMTDVMRLNSFVPEADSVKKVTLKIDTAEYTFTSPEAIRAVADLADRGDNTYSDLYDFNDYSFMTEKEQLACIASDSRFLNFKVAFKPKFGLTLARNYSLQDRTKANDVFRALRSCEEFREVYAALLAEAAETRTNTYGYLYEDSFGVNEQGELSMIYNHPDITDSVLVTDFDEGYFDRPMVDLYTYYNSKNEYRRIPLCLGDRYERTVTSDYYPSETVITEKDEAVSPKPQANSERVRSMLESDLDQLAGHITYIRIIDCRDPESQLRLTDVKQIRECLPKLTRLMTTADSAFTLSDPRYFVVVMTDFNLTSGRSCFSASFLEGLTPDFVNAAFPE